jgi:hypothetical protein
MMTQHPQIAQTDQAAKTLAECEKSLFEAVVRARKASGVHHDFVPLLNQKFGGHLSEAVCGSGHEDAHHSVILLLDRF